MWFFLSLLPVLAYAASCVDSNQNVSAMGVLPPCYLASVAYTDVNVKTFQSYYFNASSTGSWLVGFTFRQDPGFWTFTNPSVTASIPMDPTQLLLNANLSQGGNILVNGATVSAPLYYQVWFQAGQPPPAAGTWSPGQWYDGAVGTFDGIYQGITVTQNTLYKLSFYVSGTQASTTNTIQLGVYALPCANVSAPTYACTPPPNLGFAVAIPDSPTPTSSITPSVSSSNSTSPSVSFTISTSPSVSSFKSPSTSSSLSISFSLSVVSTSSPSISSQSTLSPSVSSVSTSSPSVSQSVFATSSITSSVFGSPSISSTSSSSTSVSNTVSNSKTNSKSLTMTTTTCPTPSIISALISATGTPLFLITAFPTPSVTVSPSMNFTLGGASTLTDLTGTIMGGVSVGLVGVLGAVLAALHLPRISIPQNLLKNPFGTISKLVSDIKDPSKALADIQNIVQDDTEAPTTVNVDSNIVVSSPAPTLPTLSQAQKIIAQSFRAIPTPPRPSTPVSPTAPAPTPKQQSTPATTQKPVSPVTPTPKNNNTQPPAPQKPKQDNNKNQKAKIELDLKDLPAIQAYLNSKKTQHKVVQ